MASLDEVLSGEVAHVDTADGAIDKGTTEHTAETPEAAPAAVEGVEEGDGAPAAPGHDKTVPLKALEAERNQRQDWKEKAVRFEEQLKAVQTQMEQLRNQPAQQPQQQIEITPEMQRLSDKLDMSEMIAREKYPDLDEKFELFKAEVAKNPALHAEALKQKHPYDWIYKQSVKLQALAEIGDDPTAYQQKLRDQIKAELEAAQNQTAETQTQQPAAPNAALNLPKSLATARSAGPRSAPTWTGPTPLDNILKR